VTGLLIKSSTKYADTVKIGSREYMGIINVVFDGVVFWNEYSNIRSEKPTSIRSLKNGIRASPNENYGKH
jgi:hypothetical protein